MNETAPKFAEADALVIGSPVYYASPAGGAISFMDRLFFSTPYIDKTMKVGASVVSCRRGGNTATFDALNKYFTICGMPVASSQYWNMVYGNTPEEVRQDKEGLQTMRTLGRNMAFLMKSIALGKAQLGLPEKFLIKPPSDGLTGKTDEDNLGFSYHAVNEYVRRGVVDADIKERIDALHRASRFKFQTLPVYHNGLPMALTDETDYYN